MPNHIANRITGSAADIAAIVGRCSSGDARFDFERLIKMPSHQPGVFFAEGGLSAGDEAANPRGNWYAWSAACWGTKWNSYSFDLDKNTDTQIYFETAWAFPMPIACALAAALPDIDVVWEYADENFGSNYGRLSIKDGQITFLPDPEEPEQWAAEMHGREYEPDAA